MSSDKKTPETPQKEHSNRPTDVMEQQAARDVLSTAGQIMNAAIAESTEERDIQNEGLLGDDNVADKFKGLPMRDLIGGPLIAAAEAQQNLASVAWDFYQKIAFKTDDSGKPTAEARTMDFTVNRPVEIDGKIEMVPQEIQAPFIGLVPIPSLLIDRIDVDFQMEVTDTNVAKTSSSAEASTSIKGGWWVAKAEVSGKVSSSRDNTRTTNQTAKYQVHVTASQQPQTEGLSRLMDIMASCIEPVVVAKK